MREDPKVRCVLVGPKGGPGPIFKRRQPDLDSVVIVRHVT